MSTRVELFAYIKKQLKVEPDYPFARYPDTVVFRHPGNRKWFAAVIRVNGNPRKNKNTASLLGKIVEGAASTRAEAELVHSATDEHE